MFLTKELAFLHFGYLTLLFNSCRVVECCVYKLHYSGHTDCVGKSGTNFVLSTLNSVTRVDCAVSCDETYQCLLFFFNTDTRSCTLHSRTLTDIGMTTDVHSDCFVADDAVESWIAEIIQVSSSYTGYPASAMLGPADTMPWTSYDFNTEDFVEVKVANDMYIEQLDIYEYYAGAIKGVSFLTPGGIWYPVWNTNQIQSLGSGLRVFSPNPEVTHFKTSSVRVDTGARSQVTQEIDAIKVRGRMDRIGKRVNIP